MGRQASALSPLPYEWRPERRRSTFNLLLQNASRGHSVLSIFRHWGAFGLFFLTILDSSPAPTFGGPDVLLIILVSTHRNPWYEYAVVATIGSVLGSYITFRLARKAGKAYLESKFGQARVAAFLTIFEKWGTSMLIASTAIPFPFPTSLVFAAAGASGYGREKFLAIVAASRGIRYVGLAILADLYGRHIARIFRHPTQYWGWMLVFLAAILALGAAGLVVQRKLATQSGWVR